MDSIRDILRFHLDIRQIATCHSNGYFGGISIMRDSTDHVSLTFS